MSVGTSTLSPITLGEKDKLRGYENFSSWKILMLAHGKPKGLHKYWQNKISVPADYEQDQSDEDAEGETDTETETPSSTKTKTTTPTTPKTATATTQPASVAPTPLHSTTPSLLEYELRESVALSSIIINIDDIYGTGINPNKPSHVAWEHLESQYGRATDRARNMREEALANCKLAEGGKVAGEDGHIERMRTLRQRANDAGAKINDVRFITKLLDSFPESWDPVITPMYGEIDLSKVIMNLTTHAERLSIRESKNTSSKKTAETDTVRALETTVLALQAEVKQLRNGQNSNKSNLKCANTEHCGKTGHLIEDCFQLGGGKAGQYPRWWKGKRTAPTIAANMATTSSSTNNGAVTSGTHYALSATIDMEEINRLIIENSPVEQRVHAILAATDKAGQTTDAIVADSGCTTYFFKDRAAFTNYKPVEKLSGQSSKVGAGRASQC